MCHWNHLHTERLLIFIYLSWFFLSLSIKKITKSDSKIYFNSTSSPKCVCLTLYCVAHLLLVLNECERQMTKSYSTTSWHLTDSVSVCCVRHEVDQVGSVNAFTPLLLPPPLFNRIGYQIHEKLPRRETDKRNVQNLKNIFLSAINYENLKFHWI